MKIYIKTELIKEDKPSSAEAINRLPGRYGSSLVLRAGRKVGTTELYYLNSRTLAEAFAAFVLQTEGLRLSVERVGFQYLVGVEATSKQMNDVGRDFLEEFNKYIQDEGTTSND